MDASLKVLVSMHYLFSLCVTVYTTTLFFLSLPFKVQNPPLEHSSFLSVPPKKPSKMGFDEVRSPPPHTHRVLSWLCVCMLGSLFVICVHPGVHDQSGPEIWPSWADAEDSVWAGAQLSGCCCCRWQVRFSSSSSPPPPVGLIRARPASVEWRGETIGIRAAGRDQACREFLQGREKNAALTFKWTVLSLELKDSLSF